MPAMLAAIYARYSTDKQRETSIEDQIKVCVSRAESIGCSTIVTYCDNCISGSTPVGNRPGGKELLADSRYTVLIVEGLDRLSRDIAEQETIVRRLEFRGVRIIGVADGYDSEMAGKIIHRGMRGIINQVYLDDLRHKTHRGLSGQVDRGLHAGGITYGYRSVPVDAGSKLEIIEKQAEVVRWIFEQYANGGTYKGITRARHPLPQTIHLGSVGNLRQSAKRHWGTQQRIIPRHLHLEPKSVGEKSGYWQANPYRAP
jgi:DNA invertase Pin-like site-specific DNA recombinase